MFSIISWALATIIFGMLWAGWDDGPEPAAGWFFLALGFVLAALEGPAVSMYRTRRAKRG